MGNYRKAAHRMYDKVKWQSAYIHEVYIEITLSKGNSLFGKKAKGHE